MLLLLCLLLPLGHTSAQVVEEIVKPKYVQQLGGWRNLPVNLEKVKALAQFAEKNYNQESDNNYWFHAKEVLGASMQVVNGINFSLDLIMEKTGCLKEEKPENEECSLPSDSDEMMEKCQFLILEKSWRNQISVNGKKCEPYTA
ncbi:cystatin [Bombina bombina]|uniref:cystatin n=1 Tax=Bombina bombina TaxID=8345 RepID=UPI00235ACEB3|nr:cystatin [Bombina bombina]